MVRVLNMTAQADCNWKIITDNFNEAYHVQTLHPELIPYIENDGDTCQFDMLINGHNRGWFPAYTPAIQYLSEMVAEPLVSFIGEWGLDASKYTGRDGFARIRGDIQKQKRKLGAGRGFAHYEAPGRLSAHRLHHLQPVPELGDHGWTRWRAIAASTPARDGSAEVPVRPLVAGTADRGPHQDAVAGGRPGPAGRGRRARSRSSYGEKSLGVTADQDLSIAASQQAGLPSAGFRQFYLCHQERRVQRFHEVLNDYVARP